VAKKNEDNATPVVTTLPLPSSDSVLVIDLPDGQKLLVGKMSAGSVIEVATWRGTGRPDSRTNRLMLGMSNGEVENSGESGVQPEQVVNKFSAQYARYLLRNLIPIIALGFQKVIAKMKSLKKDKAASPAVRAQESSEEVQEWLTKITQSVEQSQRNLSTSTSRPQRTASKPKKSPNSQKRKSNGARKGS
jgi:N-methylhydantoinase A/oxoprolinase/acetone carboxylase beta subunit